MCTWLLCSGVKILLILICLGYL